jgi:hypothetical protein
VDAAAAVEEIGVEVGMADAVAMTAIPDQRRMSNVPFFVSPPNASEHLALPPGLAPKEV